MGRCEQSSGATNSENDSRAGPPRSCRFLSRRGCLFGCSLATAQLANPIAVLLHRLFSLPAKIFMQFGHVLVHCGLISVIIKQTRQDLLFAQSVEALAKLLQAHAAEILIEHMVEPDAMPLDLDLLGV